MRTLKRVLLAGAALVATASGAMAGGDLYGGVKDAPVQVSRSWYLRGDFGWAWQNADSLTVYHPTLASSGVDDTWTIGGGVGRYFGRGFRGDVTYEWRGNTDFTADSTACCSTSTRFSMRSQAVLANLYYDFRPGQRFNPYVGAGIGAAYVDTSGGSYPNNTCGCVPYVGKDQWNFAWALMAGVSMRLDRGTRYAGGIKDSVTYTEPGRLHLDLGYRYLNLGEVATGPNSWDNRPGPKTDSLDAHEFRVGLRYDLR